MNFGNALVQGPYHNNDMSKICRSISSHQKNITSLYKMHVILKAKMEKGPFIKKILTCYERIENLVKWDHSQKKKTIGPFGNMQFMPSYQKEVYFIMYIVPKSTSPNIIDVKFSIDLFYISWWSSIFLIGVFLLVDIIFLQVVARLRAMIF